jgi:vacuolar protein sorting-associated protein 13A/C
MRPRSHKVGLQVCGPVWETIRGIKVDQEGSSVHFLRPKIDNVLHRIVCDVKLDGNIKLVTLRSTLLLENFTKMNLQIATINSHDKIEIIKVIPAGGNGAIPIEAAYKHSILARPEGRITLPYLSLMIEFTGFGYKWSNERLFWREMSTAKVSSCITVSCLPEAAGDTEFFMQARAVMTESDDW